MAFALDEVHAVETEGVDLDEGFAGGLGEGRGREGVEVRAVAGPVEPWMSWVFG